MNEVNYVYDPSQAVEAPYGQFIYTTTAGTDVPSWVQVGTDRNFYTMTTATLKNNLNQPIPDLYEVPTHE